MQYRAPGGPNWNLRGPRGELARRGCSHWCRCVDIVPDVPSIEEADNARDTQCTSDEEDEDTVPSSVQNLPTHGAVTAQCSQSSLAHSSRYPSPLLNHVTCSDFYGSPQSADCVAAIERLPDYDERGQGQIREYRPIAALNDPISTFPTIQTPLVLTHGTCTIAVLLPEGKHASIGMVVESLPLIYTTKAVEFKCVRGFRQGGFIDTITVHHPDHRPSSDIPNIFIFGTDSHMATWLKLKLACVTKNMDKAKCDAISLKPSNKQETDSSDPRSACSGSCMDPSECDINSDCVCASNKGIPLSSSWGQHVCTHVVGAAVVLASSVLKPGSVCRGRCLLDENGTLNIPASLNVSNNMASFDNSHANLTAPSFPAAVTNIGPLHTGGPSIAEATLPLNSNESSTSDNIRLLTSESSSSNITFQDQSFAMLTCPCNCTYVSAACCGSRMVWEDPGKQIQMDPLPANASVCCDVESGNWLPKLSGCPASTHNASATEFINMGLAKFNGSAELPDGNALSQDGGYGEDVGG